MSQKADFQSTVAKARERHFPMELGAGASAILSDRQTVQALFDKHSPVVFPEMSARTQFALPDDRKPNALLTRDNHFDLGHRDYLVILKAGQPIGWFMGEQADASTYYLRNSGLLPDQQSQGLAKKFTPAFLNYLRDVGYERVTSQHLPHNARVLVTMLKAGFVFAGLEVDERWGPLVKMVCLLHGDRLNYFKTRFS